MNKMTPWFTIPTPRRTAKIRLVCFHYAGGGASIFQQWGSQLPEYIEVVAVQLPGREDRFKDQPIADINTVTTLLQVELSCLLDKPYAVFGHSMGAILSYEWLRAVKKNNWSSPFLYIPAGRQAPHIPNKSPPLCLSPDQEFVEGLIKKYPDTMRAALENTELRQLSMPKLRADFTLAETYEYKPGTTLDCPILALAGQQEYCIEEHELLAWENHTTNSISTSRLPGDHFFILSSRSALLYFISGKLKAAYNKNGS